MIDGRNLISVRYCMVGSRGVVDERIFDSYAAV